MSEAIVTELKPGDLDTPAVVRRRSLTVSARIEIPMPGDTFRSSYEKGSVIVLGSNHLSIEDAHVLQKALASAVAALDALAQDGV